MWFLYVWVLEEKSCLLFHCPLHSSLNDFMALNELSIGMLYTNPELYKLSLVHKNHLFRKSRHLSRRSY